MRSILFLFLFVFSFPAFAQTGSLEPVKSLLDPNRIASPHELNGKSAVVTVAGVGSTQTVALTPEGAFSVEKVANDKYRVTIVNGSLLSYLDDGIWRWQPLSLEAVSIVGIETGTGIRGTASCNYRVKYMQVGAGEINLTAIKSAFNVRWDLSNTAGSPDVQLDGPGLSITRAAGQQQPFDLTLHLDHKTTPAKNLSAPAVSIPSCSNQGATETIVQNVVQQVDPAVSDCLRVQIKTVIECPDCGPTRVTFKVSASNICGKPVRCYVRLAMGQGNNEIAATKNAWITASAHATMNYDYVLSYPERLAGFWTTAPGLYDCTAV